MSLTCSDSVYYLPIPLRCFRSVEVKGQTGATGSISLHAQDPPCRGWCGVCGVRKFVDTISSNTEDAHLTQFENMRFFILTGY